MSEKLAELKKSGGGKSVSLPWVITARAQYSGAPVFVVSPDGVLAFAEAGNNTKTLTVTDLTVVATNYNNQLGLKATPVNAGTFYKYDGTLMAHASANTEVTLVNQADFVNASMAIYFVED